MIAIPKARAINLLELLITKSWLLPTLKTCKLVKMILKRWENISYLLIIQAQAQPAGFWRRRALWDFPVGWLVPIWNRPFFFCYSSWEKDLTRGGSFQPEIPHARWCFFCVSCGLELRPESFTTPQRGRNNEVELQPRKARMSTQATHTHIHTHRLFGLFNKSAVFQTYNTPWLFVSLCRPLEVTTLPIY